MHSHQPQGKAKTYKKSNMQHTKSSFPGTDNAGFSNQWHQFKHHLIQTVQSSGSGSGESARRVRDDDKGRRGDKATASNYFSSPQPKKAQIKLELNDKDVKQRLPYCESENNSRTHDPPVEDTASDRPPLNSDLPRRPTGKTLALDGKQSCFAASNPIDNYSLGHPDTDEKSQSLRVFQQQQPMTPPNHEKAAFRNQF